jgi:hypothetical protein
MSLQLKDLIERGYFPQELPPPFNTKIMAIFIGSHSNALPFRITRSSRTIKGNTTSKPEIYNLARAGTLRRELSILNPIHFSFLAKCISDNWTKLEEAASCSKISLTKPILSDTIRTIARQHDLDVLASKRAELRSRGRFILLADIVRFYPSLYTHSIPWALHGKAVAKADRSPSLLGNQLDELVRNCQDGQTNGIPIGPDTSLLIAEILLSQVDKILTHHRLKGIRYVDDYELVFNSEAEALVALSTLEKTLLEYELHLNPAKIKVLALPQQINDAWVTELKHLELEPQEKKFRAQLLRFFDRAFELARTFPSENVLKYAAGRVAKIKDWQQHDELVEDLLIQCARVEAGALPFVLTSILRNPVNTSVRIARRKELLHRIIVEHAPQRHSSEVAWSLWACIALKFQLSPKVVRLVLEMEDSISALLLLHARSIGIAKIGRELDVLKGAMTQEALYESRWLLSYEANIKGWLPSVSAVDHVMADHNFGLLKAASVSFFDPSQTILTPTMIEASVSSLLSRVVSDYNEPIEELPDIFDESDLNE